MGWIERFERVNFRNNRGSGWVGVAQVRLQRFSWTCLSCVLGFFPESTCLESLDDFAPQIYEQKNLELLKLLSLKAESVAQTEVGATQKFPQQHNRH